MTHYEMLLRLRMTRLLLVFIIVYDLSWQIVVAILS